MSESQMYPLGYSQRERASVSIAEGQEEFRPTQVNKKLEESFLLSCSVLFCLIIVCSVQNSHIHGAEGLTFMMHPNS